MFSLFLLSGHRQGRNDRHQKRTDCPSTRHDYKKYQECAKYREWEKYREYGNKENTNDASGDESYEKPPDALTTKMGQEREHTASPNGLAHPTPPLTEAESVE